MTQIETMVWTAAFVAAFNRSMPSEEGHPDWDDDDVRLAAADTAAEHAERTVLDFRRSEVAQVVLQSLELTGQDVVEDEIADEPMGMCGDGPISGTLGDVFTTPAFKAKEWSYVKGQGVRAHCLWPSENLSISRVYQHEVDIDGSRFYITRVARIEGGPIRKGQCILLGIRTEGKICSVCNTPQFHTEYGDTCANGHGGAPSK